MTKGACFDSVLVDRVRLVEFPARLVDVAPHQPHDHQHDARAAEPSCTFDTQRSI